MNKNIRIDGTKVRHIFGGFIKIVLGMVIAAFFGIHSLNFFKFAFPAEQVYFAWLGFGLTGGGAVAYLIVFVTEADTPLKLVVSLGTMVISVIGELATAFYGIQVETWQKAGFTLTETDYTAMLLAVMLLGLVHAIALILYLAGDRIFWMFSDDDNDGTINAIDRVDNRKPFQMATQLRSETDRPDFPKGQKP